MEAIDNKVNCTEGAREGGLRWRAAHSPLGGHPPYGVDNRPYGMRRGGYQPPAGLDGLQSLGRPVVAPTGCEHRNLAATW